MKLIPLTKNKFAIVDKVDYDRIAELTKYKWQLHKSGDNYYAGAKIKNKSISMHRLILNLSKNTPIIDHINHNGLDNRRCNLRICSPTENQQNQIKRSNSYTSSYKGVHKKIGGKKWIGQIVVNKKQIYIGSFDSELAAANAYDNMAIKYFGEFANTNTATCRSLKPFMRVFV